MVPALFHRRAANVVMVPALSLLEQPGAHHPIAGGKSLGLMPGLDGFMTDRRCYRQWLTLCGDEIVDNYYAKV
jgi:hypothetical protein